MRSIPVGEYLLRAKGALSLIKAYKKHMDHERMWEEKKVFHKIMADVSKYDFDSSDFIEQTVWKPTYEKLLEQK